MTMSKLEKIVDRLSQQGKSDEEIKQMVRFALKSSKKKEKTI